METGRVIGIIPGFQVNMNDFGVKFLDATKWLLVVTPKSSPLEIFIKTEMDRELALLPAPRYQQDFRDVCDCLKIAGCSGCGRYRFATRYPIS